MPNAAPEKEEREMQRKEEGEGFSRGANHYYSGCRDPMQATRKKGGKEGLSKGGRGGGRGEAERQNCGPPFISASKKKSSFAAIWLIEAKTPKKREGERRQRKKGGRREDVVFISHFPLRESTRK